MMLFGSDRSRCLERKYLLIIVVTVNSYKKSSLDILKSSLVVRSGFPGQALSGVGESRHISGISRDVPGETDPTQARVRLSRGTGPHLSSGSAVPGNCEL